MDKGRWLESLVFDQTQPQLVVVLDPKDFELDQEVLFDNSIPPERWREQDWSFSTYFCKVLRALDLPLPTRSASKKSAKGGRETHLTSIRVDRLNLCFFMPLNIAFYAYTMVKAYGKKRREKLEEQSTETPEDKYELEAFQEKVVSYGTGQRLLFKRHDSKKFDKHLPTFYQHAWFNCLRPVLTLPLKADRYRGVEQAMFDCLSMLFLAGHATNNEKYRAGNCPPELVRQHQLPSSYTVFTDKDGGYNGMIFWTMRPTPAVPAVCPSVNFWHPAQLDAELYFRVIREGPDEFIPCWEQLNADRELALGATRLSHAFFRLWYQRIPLPRIYRALFAIYSQMRVEVCLQTEGCKFPLITPQCRTAAWVRDTHCDFTGVAHTAEFLESKTGRAQFHPEVAARIAHPRQYTRAICDVEEFVEFVKLLAEAVTDYLKEQHTQVEQWAGKVGFRLADLQPHSQSAAPYGDKLSNHCHWLLERLRCPTLMLALAHEYELQLVCSTALPTGRAVMTRFCDMMNRQTTADPDFDQISVARLLSRPLPPQMKHEYTGTLSADQSLMAYHGEMAAFFLYELFQYAVMQPVVVTYCAYWAPADRPSLTEPGVFWIPPVEPKTEAIHLPIDLDSLGKKSPVADDEDAPLTKGFSLRAKPESPKPARGGRGRGRGGARRHESRLAVTAVTQKLSTLVSKAFKANAEIDMVALTQGMNKEIDTWNLKTHERTTLLRELQGLDENTSLSRALTIAQLLLGLKRRCTAKDTPVYALLAAAQPYVTRLKPLLSQLWEGDTLLADIPPTETTPASSSSSSILIPASFGPPDIWNSTNATSLVRYLYQKFTEKDSTFLSLVELDTLVMFLTGRGCNYEIVCDHIFQALAILFSFSVRNGQHQDAFPFLDATRLVRLGLNLRLFIHHFTCLSTYHDEQTQSCTYVVTPPRDHRERLAYKLSVSLLIHSELGTVLENAPDGSSSAQGTLAACYYRARELVKTVAENNATLCAEAMAMQLPTVAPATPEADSTVYCNGLQEVLDMCNKTGDYFSMDFEI